MRKRYIPGNKKYSDNRFDPLSSQAYCLKVKEMDDEEFEAAVSPFVTHPHSTRLLTYIQTSLWVSAQMLLRMVTRGWIC